MPLVSAVLLVAVALAGCSTPQPTPAVTKKTVPSPMFASDAEALAAATKAYAAYLKVSDEIFHEGGADPARIKPYVTAMAYVQTRSSFKVLRDRGWHTVGESAFSGMEIERFNSESVSAFLCSDVTNVRVIDDSGADVTPESRAEVLPIEVTFRIDGGSLRLNTSDSWSGSNFC